MPRLPRIIAASMPAGPAPTTSTSLSAFLAGSNFSGCQPRRYSSPAHAFWVQMSGGPPISQREMQTLQPMHSRMSSRRPSSIFFGRNGSEIDGRQVAMMSSAPPLIASIIRSGLVQRPTPSTGFFVTSLIRFCQGIARPDAIEARRRRVLAPLGDAGEVDVPDVDEMVDHLGERDSVALELRARLAEEHVAREPNGDRGVVADGLLDLLDRLAPEAGAVLERAAVLVRSLVVEGRQELLRQVRVRAVDVDDVEPGRPCALGSVDVHLLDVADVVLVHLDAVRQVLEVARDLGGPARDAARLHAGGVRAGVPQLAGGEGVVLVEHVAHDREVLDVVVVPEAGRDAVGVVRLGRDRAVLRADAAVAALGLHRPEVGLVHRLLRAESVAVRNLVEAVLHRLRAELDRLEENVVPGVSSHRAASFSSTDGAILCRRLVARDGTLGRTRLRRRTMAVTTRNGAFIGGEWVEGDGEEIEVTSPATGEVIGSVVRVDSDAGRHGGTGRGRGISRLAQDIGRRARRDLPPGLHAVHGAQRGDRADDLAGGRQDDPRVTRGDGGVHGRPLPSRLRGCAAPRRQGAALDPGALERKTHPDRPGAGRGRCGRLAVELPGRHRGDPDRLRARGRLHRRLEAVRVRAALREHVRGGPARCRVPSRHDQRRPRPRRRRPVARHPSAGRLRRLHRVGRDWREGCPRRGPEEPRARARRERAADRPGGRRHRQGRGRCDRRLLLPRRPMLHGCGADPRPRVGEGRVPRRPARADEGAARRRSARRGDRHGPGVHAGHSRPHAGAHRGRCPARREGRARRRSRRAVPRADDHRRGHERDADRSGRNLRAGCPI